MKNVDILKLVKKCSKIQEHERMPTTGRCNSLDGLLVETGYDRNYLVFRQLHLFTLKHEALYTWETYLRKNLKQKKSNLPKKIEDSFNRLVHTLNPRGGFTAQHVVGSVL